MRRAHECARHVPAVLQETDAAGAGVVLVASADRLVLWYARHGFASVPGENPRVMYRRAA